MKTVAVIFGGRSAEHDISIVTAISSIIRPLELSGNYKVEPIYITKDGVWIWDDQLKDISLFTTGKIGSLITNAKSASVNFGEDFYLEKPAGFGKRKSVKIDVVFPAMHGTYGEDGSLMGLLEMADVPYAGCSLSSSVLAMDKVLAKQIAESNGVPIAKYTHFSSQEFNENPEDVIKKVEKSLKFPVFVKPAHLGSSIGITRVAKQKDLRNAIEVAAHYDDKVLVEEEIKNLIEVTLPIMGNNDLTPALLERPLSTAEDFFDFDTKYLKGGKKGGKKGGAKKGGVKGAQGYSELPAKLPVKLYGQTQETALKSYRALGCSGTARVDLLIDNKAQKVYFNEVNPLPGSLYAHNWQTSGVSSIELVESLVNLAIERHEQRQELNTAFTTNFLKQF